MDKDNAAINCSVYTIASKVQTILFYSILTCSACVYLSLEYSILDLELVNLVLAVSQLAQNTSQLSLVLRALLASRNSLVHSRWATDKDLDVLGLGLRQHGLQELLGDESLLEVGCVLGWVVERVEDTKTLGVGVLEVLELALEQDVLLGNVTVDEGHLGLVLGVVEDGAGKLVHGGDTSSSGYKRDVVMLVGGPGVLRNRALDVKALVGLHVVEMGGHWSIGIFLN